MHVHLVRRVADRRHDGDLDAVHGVGESNHGNAVVGGALGCIVLGEQPTKDSARRQSNPNMP